ncbi:MAG: LptA/OstA family protein [Kiritimatiellia bacterium]|jgi:lipopolysaccharide transport protein LptA
MMKFQHCILTFCLCLVGAVAIAAKAPVTTGEDEGGTVITSRSLNFEHKKREAVFDGNVLVVDPQLRIKSDRLTVIFTEDNQVQKLIAEGRVQIEQEQLAASGGRAVYDVAAGKVVLSINPLIRRGRDMLTGETITFWRDSNRILCEPNARLVLHSEREALTGITGRK